MKKRLLATSLALALMVALAACSSMPPTALPTPAPRLTTAQPQDTITLEVVGPTETKILTLTELQALPAVKGWAGIKNSVGKITQPTLHKGVALEELCKLVGGMAPEYAVEVVAEDGYAISLSYEEAKGNVIAYDPISGAETKIADALQVIVAYERDGQPLPADSDGSLRMAVISPRNNQVTDGHWAVKWVRKIVIKPVSQ